MAHVVYCSATDGSREFPEKLEAAAEAGFSGISLRIREYVALRANGCSDSDLARLLTDAGLFLAEVSTASDWLSGVSTEEEEIGIAIARRFGAEGLNCTPLSSPYLGLNEAVSAFQAICDRALRHGVRCHIEFVPWREPGDLRTAWEIVRRADRPNGGLMFDTWHFYRSNGSLSDLRTVDPSRIFAVQLSDATLAPRFPDLAVDSCHRLLPGHGSADLVGCIRVLDELGVDVPFGAEVISPDWTTGRAVNNAAAILAAVRQVVALARKPRRRQGAAGGSEAPSPSMDTPGDRQ